MRILIIVENLSVPRDRRVWQEARAAARGGLNVVVISPQGATADKGGYELREGVEIHRYPPSFARGGIASYLIEYATALWRTSRLVRRLSRDQTFDIVHACNPPDLMLLAALPLRLRGTRFVFDHHDLVPELFRSRFGNRYPLMHAAASVAERLAFRMADVVLSTNESFKRIALSRGRKNAADVFVVRNGPDIEVFRPGPADVKLRGNKHVFGYVGTMGPQDGVDHALRALALLAQRRDDWHAVFAGEGDSMEELRELSISLGIDARIEFVGHLDQHAVVRLLRSVDICLAPEPKNEMNDRSTLIKIAEYMAVARPVVCFDLAESRVTAGNAAEYAKPNDDAHFADCLESLMDDPGRRESMGAAGRLRVEQQLAWHHSERALLAAYAQCARHRMDRATSSRSETVGSSPNG